MKKIKPCVVFLASLLLVSVSVSAGYCVPDEKEGQPVVSIKVKNNNAISEETILSKLKTHAGGVFSQQDLNDDLKRLYVTDYFLDVAIDASVVNGGVAVVITVEEKPIIDSIVFRGNKTFASSKLASTIKSKAGEVLNHAVLTQDMLEIKKLYEKKGYQQVEAGYEVAINRSTNRAVVTVAIDEKIKVKVSKVTVAGNKSIKTGKIIGLLSTKPAWLFNAGVFQEDILEEDLDKVRNLYENEGFLDVKVSPKIEHDPTGKLMYITIEIEEGKKYFAGDVLFRGELVYPESQIRAQLALVSGKAFSARTLKEDIFKIRQYYQHSGYMNAEVNVDRNLNAQTGNIDLVYTIDSKDVVYVGKIDVSGNMKTKDIVVRRELRIYPGEKFDGDKLRKSKERLYNLGFFEDVYFDTRPTNKESVQDLVVSVKESKTGEFAFGGGYSTIDEFIGFVEVSQRNFDIANFPSFMGAGQNLSLKAELGSVKQDYLASWTDPWILGYPFSFGFDGYRTSHDKKLKVGYGYSEVRSGGDVRLGKEFTDEFSGDAIYRLEQVEIEDVSSNSSKDLKNEEGTNWISSVSGVLTYDTRDNKFNPTKGWYLTGGVEDAGGVFGGDKDFYKITGTAAYYKLFFDKFVLELKLKTGLANAYGDSSEVPIYERFYAGGGESIRGYGERRVSPRDPGSNDPVGGEAMLVGNAEVTFPLYEKLLKGAVFYDAGNTWRRIEDYGSGALRSGIGVGIRIKTPLGPVKLDYGYPLNDNYDEEKKGQFYFSITRGF